MYRLFRISNPNSPFLFPHVKSPACTARENCVYRGGLPLSVTTPCRNRKTCLS